MKCEVIRVPIYYYFHKITEILIPDIDDHRFSGCKTSLVKCDDKQLYSIPSEKAKIGDYVHYAVHIDDYEVVTREFIEGKSNLRILEE